MFKRIITVLLMATAAWAAEYTVDKEKERVVKFTSDAPVEKIVGTTTSIDGYILVDETAAIPSAEFYFTVDLGTLDTGIGLRNRHMRENYLETKKYPFAVFSGKIMQADTLENGDLDVRAKGQFELHGVKKEMEIAGIASQVEGGYRAVCQFSLALADFGIKRPQLMLLKIGEAIAVEVVFNVQRRGTL